MRLLGEPAPSSATPGCSASFSGADTSPASRASSGRRSNHRRSPTTCRPEHGRSPLPMRESPCAHGPARHRAEMSDDRGLAARSSYGSDLARSGELSCDLDAKVGVHRIPILGGMVIHEDVVSIGPQAGLGAQECPDLIEGRPPDLPNSADGNLSPDGRQQPWRNHFDLDVWTHLLKPPSFGSSEVRQWPPVPGRAD